MALKGRHRKWAKYDANISNFFPFSEHLMHFSFKTEHLVFLFYGQPFSFSNMKIRTASAESNLRTTGYSVSEDVLTIRLSLSLK